MAERGDKQVCQQSLFYQFVAAAAVKKTRSVTNRGYPDGLPDGYLLDGLLDTVCSTCAVNS